MFKIDDIKVDFYSIYQNKNTDFVTDSKHPSISYKMISDRRETSLRSACIEINGWKKQTNEQVGIQYEGEPLKPFTRYTVIIEAWDDEENHAEASADFMTGKMGTPWKAKWITNNDLEVKSPDSPAPIEFRKTFNVPKTVKNAYIVGTAMGIVDLYIDGKRINDDYFTPGFTDYDYHLQYGYYSVPDLSNGIHELKAIVAAGWAVGRTTNISNTNKSVSLLSAERPSLLAELTVEYADGTMDYVATSDAFETAINGAYKFADFYDGEVYDTNVSELKWKQADVASQSVKPEIIARYGEKVMSHEILKPVSCTRTKANKLIYDFGQNIAGVVEFHVNATKGQVIAIRHAETLDGEELYVQNLRSAKQTIVYTCKDGEQTYSPRFTYMGFQYIEIDGIEEENICVEAKAIYSDFKQIGSFSCSNEDLNQLQSNLVWSGKDNFVDIPTDCPQRDERQGWTGDIALFSETACFNFELNRFLMKWLMDMKAEQGKLGSIPFVVPIRKGVTPSMTTSCWGDSCIMVPYALYMSTGNKAVLQEMYPVMKKYLADVGRWATLGAAKHKSKNVFALPFQFGDWCAPYGSVKEWLGKGAWTGTAYYSYACSLMSKIAEALGNSKDEVYYKKKSEKIAATYLKKFMDENGAMPKEKEFQTGYVLPLQFQLANEKLSKKMARNLWRMIEENGVHLNTGFTATPYILFALSDYGLVDEAFKLLLQDSNPSWLYQIRKGATTTWEQWDIITESGEIKEGSMNHYAYGSVGAFLYKRICGLEAIEPGYRKFRVKPLPGGELTYAKCSHNSPYGMISIGWEKKESDYVIEIEVPVGSTCQVELPNQNIRLIGSGKYEFTWK